MPLLLVSLVLSLLNFASSEQPPEQLLVAYLRRPEVGHMWFAGHLLVYACGYVAWRRLAGRRRATPARAIEAPGHRGILAFTLGLAVVSFVVRIAAPIDRWFYLAPFLRAELAHVPQYLGLYILGIMAYRREWFERLPAGVGKTWLKVGLLAAALPYGIGILRELTPIDISLFDGGGLNPGSLLWSTVEACICVGLCVGLLTLFRERADRHAKLPGELAAGSYAVYIIHIFPVVGLQMALTAAAVPPLAAFGVVTLLAVPLCFGLAYGLRRLPGMARVL